MAGKILMVDDDGNLLSAWRRSLRGLYVVETALSGEAGLRMLESQGPFAVAVSDFKMPGMDGTRFLAEVRKAAPDTVRIMLTGYADLQAAADAINEGNIFRFLTKPCPPEKLTQALEAGLRQYQLIRAERELLENTLGGSIKLLADLLELVSPIAFGRASRIQQLTRLLLPRLGRENAWELDLSALLSQVGLLTLPDEILLKIDQGETLSTDETRILHSHPKLGHDLVANIPRLEGVAGNISYQLKHFDGAGPPPNAVHGRDIPLGGRVLKAVVDYDALQRSGMSNEEAIAEMNRRKGWYDPAILAVLQGEIVKIETGYSFRLVDVEELKEGMLVRDGIRTKQGNLLVGRGQVVTRSVLARVQNFARWQEVIQPVSVLVPTEARPPENHVESAPATAT